MLGTPNINDKGAIETERWALDVEIGLENSTLAADVEGPAHSSEDPGVVQSERGQDLVGGSGVGDELGREAERSGDRCRRQLADS